MSFKLNLFYSYAYFIIAFFKNEITLSSLFRYCHFSELVNFLSFNLKNKVFLPLYLHA